MARWIPVWSTLLRLDTQRLTIREFEKDSKNIAPTICSLLLLVRRLVAHFHDPGNLTSRQDIFNYMRLLEGTFKDKDPDIKMSIDTWAADAEYLPQIVDNGFRDYLVLEQPCWLKLDQQESIHRGAGAWA